MNKNKSGEVPKENGETDKQNVDEPEPPLSCCIHNKSDCRFSDLFTFLFNSTCVVYNTSNSRFYPTVYGTSIYKMVR